MSTTSINAISLEQAGLLIDSPPELTREPPIIFPHPSPAAAPARPLSLPRFGSFGVVLSRVMSFAGAAGIAGVLIGGLMIAALGAAGASYASPLSSRSLASFIAGPLAGLWPGHAPADGGAGLTGALLIGMFCCYLLALACAGRIRWQVMLGAAVLVQTVMFLGPPFAGTDIFNYLQYARIGSVFHLNPYRDLGVDTVPGGTWYVLSNWHYLKSPYGPLFTLICYPLSILPPAAGYWALKTLTLTSSFAVLGLVCGCAKRLGVSRSAAVAFVGLNPLIVVWGVGGEHNDFLAVAVMMLGLFLLCAPRIDVDRPPDPAARPSALASALGGMTLALAAGVKATAVFALAPLLAGAQRRFRVALGALIGGALVLAAVVLCFGGYLPNVTTQDTLVSSGSLPNLLGVALGFGGDTLHLQAIENSLLVAAMLVVCALALARRISPVSAAALAALALMFTLSWSLPWYALWFMCFAALSRSRTVRWCCLLCCAVMLIANFPQAQTVLSHLHLQTNTGPLSAIHRHQIGPLLR